MRKASWSKLLSLTIVFIFIYIIIYNNSGSKLQKSYFYNSTQFRSHMKFIESTLSTTYNHDPKIVVSFVVCDHRLEEALNVVKSALIFTRSPLHFVIFSDDKLQPLVNNTLMKWKKLRNFQFELHQMNFPKSNQEDWLNLFSKCAAQRLFYPNLLKGIDSLIYVDIDTLFLGPVDEVWGHFNKFKSKHMVGLVLENGNPTLSWYPRFAQHPFYGKTGLNSGVMLMDLNKMRMFSWVDYVTPIMLKWKLFIPWGDQDIINIILHFHPEAVYEMSCRYNYRPDLCMYGEGCPEATTSGVHLLHGSRSAFQNDKQPIFKAVYKAINEHNLETSDINLLVLNMNKYMNETPKSMCGEFMDSFIIVPNKTVSII